MYVFGNGESRTSVNIDKLEGTKVGCNAIYRDYTMDHLICVDRRMVQESLVLLIQLTTYTKIQATTTVRTNEQSILDIGYIK